MSREVPAYRRRSNGQAFVQHKSIPTSDHRLNLGVYGSPESHAKYQRFLEKLARSREENSPVSVITAQAVNCHSLEELLDLFDQHAMSKFQENGRPTKHYVCLKESAGFILTCLDRPGLRLPDAAGFNAAHLVAIQETMAGLGYCRRHINQTVKRIRQIFKWACFVRLVPESSYAHLLTVNPLLPGDYDVYESQEIEPVSWEVIETTARYASRQVAAMMKLQYLCAMRPNEVCRMKPMHIDQSDDIWIYTPPKHKNTRRLKVLQKPIGPDAQVILAPFLENCLEDSHIFSPKEVFIELSEDRRRRPSNRKPRLKRIKTYYSTNSYRQAVRYATKKGRKAGEDLPDWFPLQIRHAAATDVNAKLGKEAAQEMLGHSDPKTTEGYIKRDSRKLVAIARQLARKSAS